MPHISYIEFNVPDVKRAAEFYKKVFDWDAKNWEGDPDYSLVSHGEQPGIDTGLRKAPDDKPLAVGIITVPKLDETLP